jgi:DNA repair ATPase RecN
MLKSVELKNFQAHSELDVPISPGITVIVGPSNAGKSSVFRAIRWVVEHKPISGLQKHGEDNTSVKLKTDNGSVIRFKNEDGYGYSVDGGVYVACANAQPAPVRQVLGLSEICLQGQHDPPFLLTLTPGQMARELNRIVDLSVIDQANSEINSRHNAIKATVQSLETLAEQQAKTCENMAWISVADERLTVLEKMYYDLESAHERKDKLEQAISRLESVSDQIGAVGEMLVAATGIRDLAHRLTKAKAKKIKLAECLLSVDGVCGNIAKTNALGKQLSALAKPAKKLDTAKQRLRTLVDAVEQLQRLNLVTTKFSDQLQKLLAAGEALNRKKQHRDKIYQTLSAIADWQGKYLFSGDKVQKLEIELQQEKETQKLCPLCQKPLNQ